jgi:hypothetical protein
MPGHEDPGAAGARSTVHFLGTEDDLPQIDVPDLALPRFSRITGRVAELGSPRPAAPVWAAWRALVLFGGGYASDIQRDGGFGDLAETLRAMDAMLSVGLLVPDPDQDMVDPTAPANAETRYVPGLPAGLLTPAQERAFHNWGQSQLDPAVRTRAVRMLPMPLPRPVRDVVGATPGLTAALTRAIWRGLDSSPDRWNTAEQIADRHGLDVGDVRRFLDALHEDSGMIARKAAAGEYLYAAAPIDAWLVASSEFAHFAAWNQEQAAPDRVRGVPGLPYLPAAAHTVVVVALANRTGGPDLPTIRLLMYWAFPEAAAGR